MLFYGTTWFVGFLTKKRPKMFYDAKLIFWSFATFFGLTIFDQVPNKGSALVKFIILSTRAHWFCYVVTGHWFIFLAILSFYSEYKAIPHILHGKFKQYDDEFVLKNTYILTKIIFILPWNFSYYQDIGKVLRQRS